MRATATRLALSLAMLAGSVSIVSAQQPQPVESYRTAVDTYVRTGDAVVAVKPLLGWSRDQLVDGVKAIVQSADVSRIEAAAMLHLEIGTAIVGISTPSASGYLELGLDLLDGLVPSPPGAPAPLPARREEAARIRHTWLRVASSAFLSVGDTQRSRQFADRSLRIMRSAESLTMRGMVDEMEGAVYNPADWDLVSQRSRAGRERMRLLMSAEEHYNDALRLNPAYPLAHIRLGRVMFLGLVVSRPREARASLERGLASATEPSHRYFGDMFMGALLQSQKDYAAAKAAFERALQTAPRSQAAVVALANVELLIGRPDRAQQIAQRYITTVDPDEPWWSFKNPTLDTTGLRWLRQRVVKK